MPNATKNTTACELRAGALHLALRPDLGGSIAGLWHDGRPVLRSTTPEALASSRASACYPLVPYSNRLGYRRFRWKGHEYTTAANFDDSPHSLHGVGWRRPWSVAAMDEGRVALALAHAPDADWPFAFDVLQEFALGAESLHVRMVFTNRAEIAQPVGLGWHPHFPKRARSRLHAECSDRWDADPAQLPVRRVAQPGIDGDVVHMDFDHCFEGWRGAARIRDELFSLQLTSSLDRLVVFTPQQRDYFCVEPVGHVSNAIHMADPLAHGLASVAPGESLEAWMRLEVRGV
jgi:aldose 1-epimerase